MKKGFTLIELLIVVAIIGILAGVGIPMYNGYMADSKEKVTQNNHNHFVNSIGRDFLSCAMGQSSISMKHFNGKTRSFIVAKLNQQILHMLYVITLVLMGT